MLDKSRPQSMVRLSTAGDHDSWWPGVLLGVILLLAGWPLGVGASSGGNCQTLTDLYGCSCTKDEVKCNAVNLTELPKVEYFPSGMKSLYLKENKLKSVDFSDNKFNSLEILDLSSNELPSNSGIGKAVRDDLNNLSELYLQGNQLNLIDTSYLTNTKIKILHLGNNPVERFEYGENDETAISHLYLKDLKYTEFPFSALKVFPELESLDLSGNQITTIGNDAFGNNKKLKILHLENNKLSSLPEHIFDGLEDLEEVYLEDNPWKCDCNMLWLHEALQDDDSFYKNKANLQCTDQPTSALQDVPIEKFISQPCHKLARRAVPDTLQFDPKKESTDKQIISGSNGPASCIVVNQKSLFVIYSVTFDVTNEATCQQECFDNGTAYFNVDSSKCLCGDISQNCTCTDCSGLYDTIAGATSTLSGLKVSYTSPVVIATPFTMSLDWVISADHFELDFGDGSNVQVSSTFNFVHTFQYPGLFHVTISLCSSSTKCRETNLDLTVSSLSDLGTLKCPTSPYVNTTDTLALEATFTQAFNEEIVWSRTKEGETSSHVPCQGGEQLTSEGHCFEVVTTPRMWSLAQEECAGSNDGYLASLDKQELTDFLKDKLIAKGETKAWIGLKKSDHLDVYMWTDGSLLGSYTALQESHGLCVYLTNGGQWETGSCSDENSFICEYTPHSIVKTTMQLAGSPELGNVSAAPLAASTDTSVKSFYTMLFMPGEWFEEEGVVQWVTFRQAVLTQDTQLKFVVYRPECPSGKNLYEPGCEQNQFFSCEDSMTCISHPTCSADQQSCFLYPHCISRSEACSCAGLDLTDIDCGTNPIVQGLQPTYRPVGDITVIVKKSSEQLMKVKSNAGDINVKKGDFLGLLYEGNNVPIACGVKPSSKLRQLAYTKSGVTDANQAITISESTPMENYLCEFNVLYSKPQTMSLPSQLATFSSAGKYTFQYKALSSGSIQECNIQVMDPVGDIVWVDPKLNGDTIKVELSTEVKLVAKVTAGSELMYDWTIGGVNVTGNMVLSEQCPAGVDDTLTECGTDDTSLVKPFTSVGHTFTSPTSLTLRVSNKVSAKEKTFNVVLGPCMPIEGLTLCHESCNISNGCANPCEPLVKSGESTSLTVTYTQGGVSGKYTYFVNNTEKLSSQASTYTTTFNTAGLHKVKVNMTCDSHFDIAEVDVNVKHPANVADLQIQLPEGAVIETEFQMNVTADVDDNAEVNISVDFGDGKVKKKDSLVTSGGRLEWSIHYVYDVEGHYNITVEVSDPFTQTSKVKKLFALAAVYIEKIDYAPEFSLPNQNIIFKVSTKPFKGNHVMLKGTKVFYYWRFASDYMNIESTVLDHSQNYSFKTPGAYNVSLTVKNVASSYFLSVLVHVEECIAGLDLQYNGPVHISDEVNFTATITAGTNVTYSLEADNGKERINQSSPSFLFMYDSPGIYNTSVIATNDLTSCPEQVAMLTSYAIDDNTLFLLDILPDTCFMTGESGVLAAKAINVNPPILNYEWNFGNGSTLSATGLLNVTILYDNPGNYKISVARKDSPTEKFSKTLCVQDEITGLQMIAPTPISIVSNNPIDEMVNTSVSQGSDIKYQWKFNGVVQDCDSSHCDFSLLYDGSYVIHVNASNNVSYDTAEKTVEAFYVIEIFVIHCNSCKNENYIATNKDAEIGVSTENATSVSYYYDFGNGYTGDNTSSYHDVGVHQVCVNASNRVSSNKTCIEIITQDAVKGFTVTSNSSEEGDIIELEMGMVVEFIVNYTAGTNVTIIWDCGDGNVVRNTETHHICTFTESKLYSFKVKARNEVSIRTLTRQVFAIREILSLSISHTLFNGRYVGTGEAQNMTAVGNTDLRVTFVWQVFKATDNNTAICNVTGKKLEQNCKTFSIVGLYFVKLFANNSINSRSAEVAVEAVERIKDLRIETQSSVFEVNSTEMLTAMTSVSKDTALSFKWQVKRDNMVPEVLSSSSQMVSYFFNHVGQYEIEVNTTSSLEPEGKHAEKKVTIEEPISGVTITSAKTFTYLEKSSSVTFNIRKSSGSHMDFKWTLSGPGTSSTSQEHEISHTFESIGEYILKVEVRNQVSNDSDITTIYVEEVLTSVDLKTNSTLIDTQTMMVFRAVVSPAGTFKYNWTVDSNQLAITTSTFYEMFPIHGVKVVQVFVHNNVSGISQSKTIFVQEAISGLTIDNCDSKVTGEQSRLEVNKSMGSDITYTWTITKPDGSKDSSQEATLTYNFDPVGFYTIVLSAVNNVSAETASCTLRAQGRVHVTDIAISSDMFVNREISFEAKGMNFADANIAWLINGTEVSTGSDKVYSQTFTKAGIYEVQVNITNEVSSSQFTKTFQIHVLDCELPLVRVVSKMPAVTKRSRYFVLAVSINTSNCEEYQSKHLWKIYRAANCKESLNELVSLGSSYTESLTLHLQPRTLPTGSYCAVFNTSYVDTFVYETAFINLTVTASQLQAVIDGGNNRKLSQGSKVNFNCLNSRDPDDLDAHLQCQWTCQPMDPSASCPSLSENSPKFDRMFTQAGHYTITLSVTDRTSTRTTTVQQSIEVIEDAVPSVSIKCVSCQATGENRISTGLQLSLGTSCSNCGTQTVEYTWTVMNDSTPFPLDPQQLLTGLHVSNLVIKEGVIPHADKYVITVSAKFESSMTSAVGISSLELDGNSGPSGGSCTVSPTEIFNLEDPVQITCSGWTDDSDDQLFYQVQVVEASGPETVSYPAYHGTDSQTEVYLASLADPASSTVNLEVKVCDVYGACSQPEKLNPVTVKPPVISTTKTEYIFNQSQSTLPALLKQNNPSRLLPYVIALIQELNHEYSPNSSLTSKEKRATIRDAITISLMAIPVSTLEDVQQVAFLLQLLTKYFDEYQTESCHLVIVESLKNITDVLQGYATQGRNQEHFVPHHLLATISNLIDSVNLGVYNPEAVSQWEEYPIKSYYDSFKNLRPEISLAIQKVKMPHDPTLTGKDIAHRQTVVPSAFEIAEQIVTMMLMTTMWLEKSIVIKLGGIEVHGHRSKVKEIWERRELNGSVFFLPDNLFQGNPSEDEEIFQIMLVHRKNPFTWDYVKNLTVNSRVPSLSFKFNNGSTIPVKGLPKSKNIKMYMFENVQNNESQTLNGKDLIKSEYHKPLSGLRYTTETVKSKKAKLVKLNTALGADSASGAHIQVRIEVIANTSDQEAGLLPKGHLDVYLGSNFQADRSSYTSHKRITSDQMAEGVDHRNYTFFIPTESFSSNVKYYLSVYNDDGNHDVNVSVSLYFSTCQYFNMDSKRWDASGCSAVDESITTVTVCSCDHLTSFGGSMLAPPSVIDITDLENLDLATNPVVMIAISVILFTYIILVLAFRKLDRLDLKRISMIPLCGQDGSHKFEVTVVTGRQLGAGTSAHIGIKLYGHDEKGTARHLTKEGAFQRNCSDTFIIAHEKSLGHLYKILIWHDNAGLSPSWYLSHVVVKDLYNHKKYYFIGNVWLSVEMEDGILKKELHVASEKELSKFTTNFKMATSHGFADKHLWMSLMDRPDHSRFTRVQRATCGVTVILFFMMVNAMWYGVLKTDSDVTRSMADYSFSWEEIVIGLVSNVVIFPVALILIALFKKSRSKENTFQQVQKPMSAQTMEIPYDFGSDYRLGPHGDWGSYYERESTTDFVPMTARLKRTQTLANVNHTFSQDGSIMDGSECGKNLPQAKSSVPSLMRTQHLMQGDLWSKENILKNWPEKVPTCPEDERKSTAGTVRGGKSSAGSKGKGKKSDLVDSDEEFMNTLDQLQKNLEEDDKKRKGSKASDKKKGKDADGLFSSDDDWVNDGLEEVKTSREKTRKTINRTPARAAGATAQTRFNPREDPKLRGRNRTSFSLDDQLSSDDELNKSKVKVTKKKVQMNGNPTGKEDSKKEPPQRKISNSSILKKRDSSRRFSIGSSMKETSFMNQPSFISPSEKSKSNMSSIWMSNYYTSNHRMREETAGCMLPSWCVYAAYALCAAISGTSIIIVLLYGYKFGAEVSLKWLLSLFISFLCSALILEPSKVLFIAMYLAARKKDVNEEIENENIDILPSVQSNETFKDVKSRPLGGFALLQAREEGHKIQRMHVMIRQFVSHMFMLTLLLAISFVHYTPHTFVTAHHLHTRLHTDGTAGLNLTMVRSLPDFQTWTETVLADTLHRHELIPLEQFGVLLGPARLRQLRNVHEDCIIKSPLNKMLTPGLGLLPCDGGSRFSEDTGSYDVGWSSTGANLSWIYHSQEELDMRPTYGREVWYSGGGYVAPLGSTHNQTLAILADLFNSDWFDLRTRAVFVEFTLYSPGLDLTTTVSILVEFPVTGGVLPSTSISTQKLLRHISGTVDPLMVCEVLFLLCVIYLVMHLALTIRDQRRKFVRSFWNWLDLVVIVIALACISLYVVCVVTATDAFRYYAAHKNGFTNFEKPSHLHDVMRQMHAWLLFVFFIKVAHQLRFIKYFHVYGKTISALLGKMAGCALIFIILLLAYAQLGYLYFGMMTHGFASFQISLMTLFGVIRGTFDFWHYLTLWPVMTHFYFYSFYAFTYGLFIALVLAVMTDTYKMTRQSMYYKATLDTQDYEMIEFIMKRFKLWTGLMKQKPAFRRVKFKGLPSLPSRGSTSMSSISRRSSITSTSSSGEPVLTEEAALHLEHQLDNAVPQWENVLSRFNKIEKLEKEEDQQMKKIEKEFKNWETKKASPKRKPTGSAFQKFQQNFRGKSQMVNKQKGLIGRTSATPPTDSPRKQAPEDERRPLSDQGERADVKQNGNKQNDNQKKRDSTKNVHFSKQAW